MDIFVDALPALGAAWEQILHPRVLGYLVLGVVMGLAVGVLPGLGWIAGKVRRFDQTKIKFKPKLPHMGWNTIKDIQNHNIFSNIDNDFGSYLKISLFLEASITGV